MSDYSDVWFEMNRSELERGFYANNLREQMVKELSSDDMIRIMFEHHISELSDITVKNLGERYLNTQ